MAKRGERRPWRVEYQWTGRRVFRESFGDRESAEIVAERIREAGERNPDADVTVRVYNRDDA